MSDQAAREALQKTLQEWMADALPPENLTKSIETAGPSIDRTRLAHLAGVNLFAGMMSSLSDEEMNPLFHRHGALVIHHWEGALLSVRALLLALHGSYNAAHTLLRSLLEVMLHGVALDYTATHMRTVSRTLTKEFTRRSGLAETLEENRIKWLADRYENDSFEFLKFLDEAGVTFNPDFQSLTKQLGVWGLLHPIDDLREYLQYSDLCMNVHGQYRRSDLARIPGGQPLFPKKPSVIPNALLRFMETHGRVADMCGVLTLNLFRDELGKHHAIAEYLRSLSGSKALRAARLRYTTQLILEIASKQDTPTGE